MRSSRAVPNNASSVSLFPFLAVLLCTMGALIVILVVIAQQARAVAAEDAAEAQEAAQAALAAATVDNEAEREALSWRVEQLSTAHGKTSSDLQRQRLELSHLEDHVRRMRAQLQQLVASAKALENSTTATVAQRQQAAAELNALRLEIAAAARKLDAERDKAKTQKASYSVVPYEGPNKTHRRPIYIECRSDSVVLQPEGIVLRSGDFESPLGPGNPLAAALRAAREFMLANQIAGVDNEPYPLLLVRPEGIAAYYKAREAIESWGPDFGYELIGSDWELDFPPSNPQLAQVEQQAVQQGRLYQERLAMAAPSRYGRRTPVYGATPSRGGFVQISGRRGGVGGEGDDGFGSPSYGGSGSAGTGTGAGSATGAGSEEGDSILGLGSGKSAREEGEAPQGGGAGPGNLAQAGRGQMGAEAQGNAAQQAAAGGKPGGGRSGKVPADQRGANWALPDSTRNATGITRPVRVVCRHDQLTILLDNKLEGGKVVPVEGPTEAALDPFVSSLWEHMDQWGIAGNGMYWKPVLILQPGPDGQQRAADLQQLLQRSGLHVEMAEGAGTQ